MPKRTTVEVDEELLARAKRALRCHIKPWLCQLR